MYFDRQFHELLEGASDDPFWAGMALLGLGRYVEVTEKIGLISDDISKKYLFSRYLYLVGRKQDSLNLSKELLQRNLKDYIRADLYRQTGNAYFAQSQLNQSIMYQTKAIELFDKLGLCGAKFASVNNLGKMYSQIGEYDTAVGYYLTSLNYYKQNMEKNPDQYRRALIRCSLNMSSAKFELHEFEDCLEEMKLAVDMTRNDWTDDQENQDLLHIYSACLANLIHVQVQTDHISEAKDNLKIIQSLPQEYYRVRFNVMSSSAELLLTSNRLRDHYKAQEILQNIIQDPQTDFQWQYLARKLLFKVLLNELHQSGSAEVMDEILYHLEKQLEISIIENIANHRLEAILIKAKLCVIASNFENALFLIDQVIDEAARTGITCIYKQAIEDKQFVENEVQLLMKGSQKYRILWQNIQTERLRDYIQMIKDQLSL